MGVSMDLKTMSFIVACNTFFPRKEGQDLRNYKDELDKLTAKDRTDLCLLFRSEGILVSDGQAAL